MMWASDFRVAMRVFTCIAAFFCGVTLSVASGEDRQRGAETILEDHWILDQITHRRNLADGMLAKAYPELTKPPPVAYNLPEDFEERIKAAQQTPERPEPVQTKKSEPAQAKKSEPAQAKKPRPVQPLNPANTPGVGLSEARNAQASQAPPPQSRPPKPFLSFPTQNGKAGDENKKKCWIFHHMNKSGGTTVKFLLKKWIHDEGYTVAQFDTEEWLQGSDFAKDFIGQSFDFYWGSYTEGLRRHGGDRCTWFTIFRHPASRLVSAYFYCQKPERFPDPLCANYVRRVDTMDLVTFAKHWTNFGLRQYVTSFILPEEITSSPLLEGMGENVPGWYKVRTVLDAKIAVNRDDPLIDAAMYKFLQPAQNLLASKYKAVGILEEFNTTLHLFNRALELPNYDWLEQYARVGAVNVNNKDKTVVYTEEDRVMDIAMTDVTIKRYLALDLLLYEHAMAIHHAQAVKYGVIEE